jgi:hypothetical protein
VFFGERPVVRIWLPGATAPVSPNEIAICNLDTWRPPPASKDYVKPDGTVVSPTIQLSLDPRRGRFRLPAPATGPVLVDYYYGFVADLGGGQYERTLRDAGATRVYRVQQGAAAPLLPSVAQALSDWASDGKPDAIIQIEDSRTYSDPIGVTVPAGRTLEIRARNGERPLLQLPGVWTVTGTAPVGDESRAALLLDGLLVAGHPIEVAAGDLGAISLRHCTLVPGLTIDLDGTPGAPGSKSLTITAGNSHLETRLERSIVGGLELARGARTEIVDSIVDGTGAAAVNASTAVLRGSTLFGTVAVEIIELAENSIFTDRATAERRQQGCVRFCYVGEDPRLPRLYRCQPHWAAREAVEAAMLVDPNMSETRKAQIRAQVVARIKPVFTETRYGRAAYAQLHRLCPPDIQRGADDESEIGVLHHLQQPQREANLRASLDEYLRAGLEAGIFFVT